MPQPLDHRGRPFEPASDAALVAADMKAVQVRLSDGLKTKLGARHVGVFLVVGITCGVAVALALLFAATNAPAWARYIMWLLLPGTWAVYYLSPLARMMQRGFADTIVASALESRQCPQCLYHLETLKPESDGCTVCPECNAAWRMPNYEQGA